MEVDCLSFVDEETNRSYPFANGLNGLAIFAFICILHIQQIAIV
jgi:hypothetical protein